MSIPTPFTQRSLLPSCTTVSLTGSSPSGMYSLCEIFLCATSKMVFCTRSAENNSLNASFGCWHQSPEKHFTLPRLFYSWTYIIDDCQNRIHCQSDARGPTSRVFSVAFSSTEEETFRSFSIPCKTIWAQMFVFSLHLKVYDYIHFQQDFNKFIYFNKTGNNHSWYFIYCKSKPEFWALTGVSGSPNDHHVKMILIPG